MSLTIDDYIIHSLEDFVRFVIIQKTKEQTFDSFSVNAQDEDSDDKNLKRIFDYIEKERFRGLESIEEDSELDLDDDEFEKLYMRSDTRQFETHRNRLVSNNVVNPYSAIFDDFGEEGEKKVSMETIGVHISESTSHKQSLVSFKELQIKPSESKEREENQTTKDVVPFASNDDIFPKFSPRNRKKKRKTNLTTKSKHFSMRSSYKSQSSLSSSNKKSNPLEILKKGTNHFSKKSTLKKPQRDKIGVINTK